MRFISIPHKRIWIYIKYKIRTSHAPRKRCLNQFTACILVIYTAAAVIKKHIVRGVQDLSAELPFANLILALVLIIGHACIYIHI